MEKLLEVKDLCKTFSNGSVQQHVLKNLNIEIYKGDFTIIMGSSGSGKSTLLYALSGIDKPTLGKITYGNEEISGYSNDKLALFRRKHCGYIFQQNYLNDTMSVMDNIMVSGLLVQKDRQAIYNKACELLGKVNIGEESYNKYPGQLSGGEAQRVSIVRSIINSPEILFGDEPTGALNISATRDVMDILTMLNQEGMSILLVTHDSRVASYCERILYMEDGKICRELSLDRQVYRTREQREEKVKAWLE